MKINSKNRRFGLNLHPMKIILSPAKLMRPHPVANTGKMRFKKQTDILLSTLKNWIASDYVARMKLSPEKGQETYQMIQQWGSKKNKVNSAPALYAYIGEAFKALDADQLTEEGQAYLTAHLFILSGLYGVLRANDCVEPYRLEMAQRGVAPDGQSLLAFWRNDVEKYLLKELQKEEPILNLASTEYSDLIQAPRLRERMYTPYFFEAKNGQLKTVSVFSKQARGTMARWCATHLIEAPTDIKKFDELGYRYSPEKSSEMELVFIR
jgi:cytoplasmic iron level regulating protein YaaA (DUF328/UPF0246 family)